MKVLPWLVLTVQGTKKLLEVTILHQHTNTVEEKKVAQDMLLALYGSLRDEIHQRVDQRQQLLTYTMVGAASFFGLGLQSWASAITVLCYPTLAFFLAC